MSAGFRIVGMEAVQKAILEAYSGTKAKSIQKAALDAGGNLVVEQLKENFEAFKDTGFSRDEIVKTNPKSKNDIVQLQIGWNGPHKRWRIIHLNEFGYTKAGKQYTPKGFGTIEKTISESKNDYFRTVSEKMRERL